MKYIYYGLIIFIIVWTFYIYYSDERKESELSESLVVVEKVDGEQIIASRASNEKRESGKIAIDTNIVTIVDGEGFIKSVSEIAEGDTMLLYHNGELVDRVILVNWSAIIEKSISRDCVVVYTFKKSMGWHKIKNQLIIL